MEHPLYFVSEQSVVRKIWGKPDIILFIFAGAAGEFALNKSVDWLYFTGRLPADPIGRLFSTVAYARQIIFSKRNDALAAISRMRAIHSVVETGRNATIPDWAYRDVLFMLIHYSMASYELLEKKLTQEEKEEVVGVFLEVGQLMGITGLPVDHTSWLTMYNSHLGENLENGYYTRDLFKQYRKHLGAGRYLLLVECQKLLMPGKVMSLLRYKRNPVLWLPLIIYRSLRKHNREWKVISLFLPEAHKKEVSRLYIKPAMS